MTRRELGAPQRRSDSLDILKHLLRGKVAGRPSRLRRK
jgi:hypothetical protein